MRLSFLTLLFTFLCTCVLAQVPSYYNDVDLTLTGSALRTELSDKVTSTETTIPSYTPGVWNALKQTDLVPGGNGQDVILVYGYSDTDGVTNTDRTRSKDDNGGGQTDWNREHVFPKSLGNPNLGTSGPGADVHHLRASDVSRNGSRGNRKFADGSGTSKITPQGHWYPGDEFKGDVARMVLYMYLRYGNRCLPSNVAIGSTNSSDANMINLLLEWNAEDPVSALEDQRNPIVEGIQGNRNPFIDNPAFATSIWGGPQAEERFGGGGNPGGGNTLCGTTVTSFPYAESFETNFGAWTNPSSGDDFNWTRNSGGTPSSNTGPPSAAAGSQYLFMESSTPNYSTKRAILYGPCFDLPSGSATFTFEYHMYGRSNMGSLALEASLNGTSWTGIWSEAGNQGNSWQTATVDLAAYAGQNVQLRFNGITGTTWQGDMAIDDLALTTGGGGGGSTTTSTNLTITFDDYPEETSWTLKNSSGTTVNSGGTYGNQADGSTINIATDLPDGCYTLTFNDVYGDGMCCAYGNGSFTLRNTTDNSIITSGGSFGSSVTRSFCVGGASLTAPDGPATNFAPVTHALGFYPNPAHDLISVTAPEGTTYRIVSQAGQLLQEGKARTTINLTTLPRGTYLLTLANSENTVTKILVRQ